MEESSSENYVLSRIKAFLGHMAKFVPKRQIVFPEESFIELTLTPKDVQKMLRWEEDGAKITPIWYCNCRRCLFVNEDILEAWKSRKRNP